MPENLANLSNELVADVDDVFGEAGERLNVSGKYESTGWFSESKQFFFLQSF